MADYIVAMTVVGAGLLDLWVGAPRRAHPFNLYFQLQRWAQGASPEPQRLRYWLVWLLVLVLVQLLLNLPVVMLPLAIIVLYLCLGAWSLDESVREYEAAIRGDEMERARAIANRLEVVLDDNPDVATLTYRLTTQLFRRSVSAIYTPLFLFAIGGVTVALAYRLLRLDQQLQAVDPLRRRLIALGEWLPKRLLVITFALLGNWQGVQASRGSDAIIGDAVANAGFGALGISQGIMATNAEQAVVVMRRTNDLIRLCNWFWIVVIACLALIPF